MKNKLSLLVFFLLFLGFYSCQEGVAPNYDEVFKSETFKNLYALDQKSTELTVKYTRIDTKQLDSKTQEEKTAYVDEQMALLDDKKNLHEKALNFLEKNIGEFSSIENKAQAEAEITKLATFVNNEEGSTIIKENIIAIFRNDLEKQVLVNQLFKEFPKYNLKEVSLFKEYEKTLL